MSYIHPSGMRVFQANETPERPASGFALIESKDQEGNPAMTQRGQVWLHVYYGQRELDAFDAGRTSKMFLGEWPDVGKAVRVLNKFDQWGEHFVYPEQHGELMLEREANVSYQFMGGQPVRDSNGFNVVTKLHPGLALNRESIDRMGMLKSYYKTLQARLLAGESFSDMPQDPELKGLYLLGQVATVNPSKQSKLQHYALLVDRFNGVPCIGGTHAYECLAHVLNGGVVWFHTASIDMGPLVDATRFARGWHIVCDNLRSEITAGAVTITLD